MNRFAIKRVWLPKQVMWPADGFCGDRRPFGQHRPEFIG